MIPTEIIGTDKNAHKVAATMHHKEDTNPGVIVYTEELREFDTEIQPFLNPDVGFQMNVNGAFGGTPEIVHVGTGDGTYWTGSNIIGSKVNFNSGDRFQAGTVSVKIDNPALNDVWQFLSGAPLAVADYAGISFWINIDKDWSTGDSINICLYDTSGAALVGIWVLVEDYVDEFNFDVWQKVTIPFDDLGVTDASPDFDAIRMEHLAKGAGKSPKFYLDTIQIEETGDPYTFRTNTKSGSVYHIDSLLITITDAYTGTLADNGLPNLSYNKLLNMAALSNGLLLQRTVDNVVTFSLPLTQLLDFVQIGFSVKELFGDGTNATIVLEQKFPRPLLIYGGDNSFLSITVTDDLTGFIACTALARGSLEINRT